MAQVNWTDRALRDLENIYAYIANDSVHYAERHIRYLISATNVLCSFPESGRAVPEFMPSDLRELIVKNYRIVYKVRPRLDVVDILAVVHGARDIESVL